MTQAMKQMRYILPLLAVMVMAACQDDEVVPQYSNSKGLLITADIPTTRTAYTSEDGITKVTWVEDDAIGIIDAKGVHCQYLSVDSGNVARFQKADDRPQEVAEGDTLWAYYPYRRGMGNNAPLECNAPNMQRASEGLPLKDVMMASGVVKDDAVNLRFRHLFTVLRMTIPTSLLQVPDNQEMQLVISSTAPIANHGGVLDLRTGELSIHNPVSEIYYEFDEGMGEDGSVVCEIVMLPLKGGNSLSVDKLIVGSHSEQLYHVKLSEEGMQAGHVYTINLDEEMFFGQAEKDRNALIALYEATGGANWVDNTNWCSDKPLSEWYGVKTTTFGSVYELNLDYNNLVGTLPPEIGDLSHMRILSLCASPLTGTLPEEFGKLDRLEIALFNLSQLSGNLPLCITDCESLRLIDFLGNNLTGSIPKEYAILMDRMKDTYFSFANNNLSGLIPEEITATNYWNYNWTSILSGNQFLPPNRIHVPEVEAMTIDRQQVKTNYKENKLTILFHWGIGCTTSEELIPILNQYYEEYKDKGLSVISHTPGWWSEEFEAEIAHFEIEYPVIMDVIGEVDHRRTGIYDNQPSDYFGSVVGVIVGIDADKKVRFTNLTHTMEYIKGFIANTFSETGDTDFYTSTDYTNDGQVVQLQEATEGHGIDLVFMGDGYSDRLHADGTYAEHMRKGMEAFFMEEPYKSHRHLFNVYAVDVVSANEVYEAGSSTALSCCFNEGTEVAGDDGKALQYALKALPVERIEDAVISVVVNTSGDYGTCYLYNPISDNDYNNGVSIAYSAVKDAGDGYVQLIQHEVGGHGFGKLGDEYSYDYKGHITASDLFSLTTMSQHGWYRNVSASNDLTTIKWKHFIEDSRYAHEQLGAYEGAFTFITGAYRPTDNSIMNQNVGGYNAPSREAIYYRINKLAYGDSWEYDYETFVQYDLAQKAMTRSAGTIRKTPLVTAPPVHVKKHWSELLE